MITRNGESIVPHQNWRGVFARGTYADGPNVGNSSDCTSYPASGCTPIQWPGERTTAYHELDPAGEIRNWFGGLVDDMRDATGQMYRRNRYYDPQTGQFTQPDPIGLAGGLNEYGFAEGDPVSYGDPYGLNPCLVYPKACDIVAGAAIGAVVGAATQAISNAANDQPLTQGIGRAALEGGVVGGALGGVATVARTIRGASLADDVGRVGVSTSAARTVLREGDAVLGVVHEGKLIAHTSNISLSHAAFVERVLGSLPAGAEVVTIGKFEGVISVLRSATFHGRALPASKEAFTAAKAIFR